MPWDTSWGSVIIREQEGLEESPVSSGVIQAQDTGLHIIRAVLHGQVDRQVDRWTDRWTDKVDRWTGGQTRWTDRWTGSLLVSRFKDEAKQVQSISNKKGFSFS